MADFVDNIQPLPASSSCEYLWDQRWSKLGLVGGWVMKGEFGRGLVTFGWKLGEELKGQTLNKYFQFYKM